MLFQHVQLRILTDSILPFLSPFQVAGGGCLHQDYNRSTSLYRGCSFIAESQVQVQLAIIFIKVLKMNTNQMTRQEVEQVGATMGLSFGILAAVVGCFNLAFIIPDLIYAYGGSTCVTTFPAGFSLTLSKWLEVDAYTRIGIVGLFFIVAVVSCISAESGVKLAIFAILALLLYSVFTVAWMIVGAIMFWGRLNPTGVCTGGVQAYMYALLIISFIGVCCNCLISSNSRNNTQQAYSI